MRSARRSGSATSSIPKRISAKVTDADVEAGSGLSGDEADDLRIWLVATQLGQDVGVEQPAPHSFTSRTAGIDFGRSKSSSRNRGSAIARTRAIPVPA